MVNETSLKNYLGFTAFRQPDGLSIKMYFEGRDVSNEFPPPGADMNEVPIIELNGTITMPELKGIRRIEINSSGGYIRDKC